MNIAKPQPRRTTRDKYKQEAGYRPVMNQIIARPEQAFHKNDVIPYENADGTISLLLMTTDIKQTSFLSQHAVAGSLLMQSDEDASLYTTKLKLLLRNEGKLLAYRIHHRIFSRMSSRN